MFRNQQLDDPEGLKGQVGLADETIVLDTDDSTGYHSILESQSGLSTVMESGGFRGLNRSYQGFTITGICRDRQKSPVRSGKTQQCRVKIHL